MFRGLGDRAFRFERVEMIQHVADIDVLSRIDVDKLRPESEDARHLWNGPECESGKNDLGIARQIERLQRVVKRHAAIRCGKAHVACRGKRQTVFRIPESKNREDHRHGKPLSAPPAWNLKPDERRTARWS